MLSLLISTVIPRISEAGAGYHIGNAIPPIWFEEARLLFTSEAAQLAGNGFFWMVRHAAYSYEHELFHGSAVQIRTGIQSIGRTSITVYQEAWQNGARAVASTATLVLFDPVNKAKVTLPPASRAHLAHHSLPD